MNDIPGSSAPRPPGENSAPPGWHPDPFARFDHRWFNGTEWTDHVSYGGTPSVDPLGAGPSPPDTLLPPTAPAPTGGNGLATAAMVCGILAMLIAWIPILFLGGIVLAALALVFGIISLRRSRNVGQGRSRSITGIVTASVGLALSIVGIALTVVFYRAVTDFSEPGPHQITVTACSIDFGVATASGTITNVGSTPQDYTVFVEIDDQVDAFSIDDLAPGADAAWQATLSVRAGEGTCEPEITVQGPFPFGIEIDPIE